MQQGLPFLLRRLQSYTQQANQGYPKSLHTHSIKNIPALLPPELIRVSQDLNDWKIHEAMRIVLKYTQSPWHQASHLCNISEVFPQETSLPEDRGNRVPVPIQKSQTGYVS